MSVAFSPDGRIVVTGSSDKTARLWEVASGREITVLRGHEDAVSSVAFNPDGRSVLTGSLDKTARRPEVASGHEVALPDLVSAGQVGWLSSLRSRMSHEDAVLSVASSSTAAPSSPAREIRPRGYGRWPPASRSPSLHGHESDVWCVAFSPDGRTVVTGSGDKTARLWPVGQGLIDRACARVPWPLTAEQRQHFGIEREWCTPELSGRLAAELGLERHEPVSAVGTAAVNRCMGIIVFPY